MEPEGSLPHSQVPATCPYPEPARSSPYPHISLPEDPTLLSIAPVEIKSSIQDNKNKNVQNNNKTSGAVWLRSMVFNGKW